MKLISGFASFSILFTLTACGQNDSNDDAAAQQQYRSSTGINGAAAPGSIMISQMIIMNHLMMIMIPMRIMTIRIQIRMVIHMIGMILNRIMRTSHTGTCRMM